MRKVAIIQARMGSSRLPGKVLKPLGHRLVLDHVVTRVMAARRLDAVVVATSDLAGDDAVEVHCASHGWTCVRGDEQDVLGRYAKAARAARADIVVRVTADCPLFSPLILDAMLERFDPDAMDYMSTNWPTRSFPVGLDCEVMRVDRLLAIAETTGDPYDREHVTPHFYRNPDRFRLASHACGRDLSAISITLDTAEDYARLEALVERRPELLDPAADVVAIAAEELG
ncbi:cytidylyltransferase domain-containing protein [Sphingomicrobium aestuariivivum]|uniref:cytidylyltransferase domain-containing protein n=1 Tax=Sphingomicrobium aestuariivivum TaxID=1582356 RepID=UPI001FD70016|nr:NTP transferase domain-containing protein [Sphingomicrobium aestuariivivum]MCJ8190774.1 NTP transferase domain-containing protein [Sphingomicrobium aestuariivivum]